MRFYLFLVVFLVLNGCDQRTETNTKKDDFREDEVPVSLEQEEVDSLKNTIYAFVKAYENRSNTEINALIHPDLGIKIIYRPGVSDTFTEAQAIDFLQPTPAHFDYPTLSNEYILTYGKLPQYDCAKEKWDKQGLFCDSTSHPTALSTIIAFENQYAPKKVSKQHLTKIKEAERMSYRVILAQNNPLVFHVQKYENRWYVVVLDRAYGGCDA